MSGIRNLTTIKSSPVKYSLQGLQLFAAFAMGATDAKLQLVSELHCHWKGFPDLSVTYFDALPLTYKKEPELYKPFIDLVTHSHIVPTLKFLDTSNKEDPEADEGMKNKPDVTAYNLNADITTDDPLSYSQAGLLFEFKPKNKKVDLFNDLSVKATDEDLCKFVFEPPAGGCQECRGQMACYARNLMSNQHCTHCFIVYIRDPWARIVRFDRTGAIVTEQFNICKNSILLLEFLWRYSCAKPEICRTDTTVTIVKDPVEITTAQQKLAAWAPEKPRCVLKLKIPDGGSSNSPHMREVLVWGAATEPWSVTGRTTCSYPGWDIKDNKHMFVKDSWRVVANSISKETDILKTLNKAGVCNVPTFVSGDDLPGQTTQTHQFASAEWNRGGKPDTFSTCSHIRFISKLTGVPLTKFKSSKELVKAWLDAVLAHADTYSKCKILHCDISPNNILITPDGNGLLNDWDLARTLDDIEKGPRQPSRSGTWQFMSITLLGELDKKHTLQDDLEAFFWVILYLPIQFLSTSLLKSGASIRDVMDTIFDTAHRDGFSHTVGGAVKEQVISKCYHIGQNFEVTNNIPLTRLILDILDIIHLYLSVWASLKAEVNIIARRKQISLQEAKAIYLENKSLHISDFSSHDMMVFLARQALGKSWPQNKEKEDHYKKPSTPQSNKRPAFEDIQASTPGPTHGGGCNTKKSKLDQE